MTGLLFCFAVLNIILLGILASLIEIKYQIERLTDMFNNKYKYFD